MFVTSIAVSSLLAAQDAAIEVQEGDVDHWIEYYKKERGLGDETDTDDKDVPKASPHETGTAGDDADSKPLSESRSDD